MIKGVILDIKKKYLVMLTPDGDFVKGMKPHDNYEIGDEIAFDPYQKKFPFPQISVPAKISSLAIVSLFIISALLLNLFHQDKAYAYVSIDDANQSVELVLNKNLQVIGTKALNQDGQKVLSKVKVEGKQNFEDIAKKVILQSKSLGYIDKNANVVITSVIKSENKENVQLKKKVQGLAPVAKSIHAGFKVVHASMNERESALKSGKSTGKYLIDKELKKDKRAKQSNQDREHVQSELTNLEKEKMHPSEKHGIHTQKSNKRLDKAKPIKKFHKQKHIEKKKEHAVKVFQRKEWNQQKWLQFHDKDKLKNWHQNRKLLKMQEHHHDHHRKNNKENKRKGK
ncbi:anti-sigma factor domain-containing protein [Bacillus sp. FJAT-49736]|uniref:anti-sigma-I factor RsgI family protein n=1 Tax=Bacillus sp. FJAT-49736 TaxID=2833582 RepID=UPI001BC9AB96|nr:anti-sigma factor domain-containing protein [Bacillus sp. FJAT-49736]MBS4172294.1 anti-sigma factor domain-containing protein [Bacillus sp. FJAT-49736]